MKIITQLFNEVYIPVKAILFYRLASQEDFYVQCLDMDDAGRPINPHPLSIAEANKLAENLNTSNELRQDFLMSRELMPNNVLHINSMKNGHAIWYTPAMRVEMLFKESLTIADGAGYVPPMVWKATKHHLYVFALSANEKPNLKTPLYFAPFFNVDTSGKVCMGNVNINIAPNCSLEEFMQQWQAYFFSSTFTHLLGDNPVKCNIIELWQKLIGTNNPFPVKQLKANKKNLKSLL